MTFGQQADSVPQEVERLANAIQQFLGNRRIDMRSVGERPSVAQIAGYLDGLVREEGRGVLTERHSSSDRIPKADCWRGRRLDLAVYDYRDPVRSSNVLFAEFKLRSVTDAGSIDGNDRASALCLSAELLDAQGEVVHLRRFRYGCLVNLIQANSQREIRSAHLCWFSNGSHIGCLAITDEELNLIQCAHDEPMCLAWPVIEGLRHGPPMVNE